MLLGYFFYWSCSLWRSNCLRSIGLVGFCTLNHGWYFLFVLLDQLWLWVVYRVAIGIMVNWLFLLWRLVWPCAYLALRIVARELLLWVAAERSFWRKWWNRPSSIRRRKLTRRFSLRILARRIDIGLHWSCFETLLRSFFVEHLEIMSVARLVYLGLMSHSTWVVHQASARSLGLLAPLAVLASTSAGVLEAIAVGAQLGQWRHLHIWGLLELPLRHLCLVCGIYLRVKEAIIAIVAMILPLAHVSLPIVAWHSVARSCTLRPRVTSCSLVFQRLLNVMLLERHIKDVRTLALNHFLNLELLGWQVFVLLLFHRFEVVSRNLRLLESLVLVWLSSILVFASGIANEDNSVAIDSFYVALELCLLLESYQLFRVRHYITVWLVVDHWAITWVKLCKLMKDCFSLILKLLYRLFMDRSSIFLRVWHLRMRRWSPNLYTSGTF